MTEISDDRQIARQHLIPGVIASSGIGASVPGVPSPAGEGARPISAGEGAASGEHDEPTERGASPEARSRGCTAAQLRRFIKSRPYVPLHELRRRFELAGDADEVSRLETSVGAAFIGLPGRECGLVQELLRQGEIGVELSVDPDVAVVVGVFPMRPVPRS